MKFGVVVFPGSNCDQDCYHACRVVGADVDYIWHGDVDLSNFDCIILPGGFSYGDYLRTGAIARFSPVMKAVERYARRGGLVLGICNGFQILLEAGLLPGAMLRNKSLKFICKYVNVRVENDRTPWTRATKIGDVLKLPIAHHDGNYFVDQKILLELQDGGQIILRYCDQEGRVTEEANPNGALDNIAGICNRDGNIFGLIPHPERAIESLLGSEDGKMIFEGLTKCRKFTGYLD